MQQISNFLMFEGNAEAAMNFYISVFPNSVIENVQKYKAGQMGREGTIVHAAFTLNGQPFRCIDSPAPHGFTFTPAMSLYVECDTDEEIERLCETLGENGKVLMPLGPYPFSKKYVWLNDRFGVSWQLSFNK